MIDWRRPQLVTLPVTDLSRSLAFWHGVLGIPIKLRCEGFAELQTEGVLVVLLVETSHDVTGTAGPAMGWEVDDLDAELAALVERGVAARELPPGPDGTGRRAELTDPDGHRLHVASHPS